MQQRVEYHDQESPDATTTCPSFPIFIEMVWIKTIIEMGMEVHIVTVDYRKFQYA
jgi:hypothetical protein